jgi:uncharacterized membrane protein
MNFFNDKELALRFKNNQVPSQERVLYYIIPLIFYGLSYIFSIYLIYSLFSLLLSLSPSDFLNDVDLKEFNKLISDIKEYYNANSNRTLSEIIPKSKLDSFLSLENLHESKTPIKEMQFFKNFEGRFVLIDDMFINGIVYYFLPIIGIVICYKTNKSGDDKEFLERFIALSFPIALRTFVLGILLGIIYLIILFSIPMLKNIDVNISFTVISFLYFYWRLNASIKIASHHI